MKTESFILQSHAWGSFMPAQIIARGSRGAASLLDRPAWRSIPITVVWLFFLNCLSGPQGAAAALEFTVPEDTLELTIEGISITDVDLIGQESTARMRVNLAVGNGVISLGPATELTIRSGGNGTPQIEFEGVLDRVNEALGRIIYTPVRNFNGDDQLDVTANDLGQVGSGGPQVATGSLEISILPVNDQPTGIIPDTVTFRESENSFQFRVTGISDGDPLVHENQTVTCLPVIYSSARIDRIMVNHTPGSSVATYTVIPTANAFSASQVSDVVSVVIRDDGGTERGGVDTLVLSFGIRFQSERPTLTVNPTSIVLDEDTMVEINLDLTDPIVSPDDLFVTIVSSRPELISDGESPRGGGASRSYKISPLPNENGECTLTFTVQARDGRTSAAVQVPVVVRAVNDAPVITIPQGQVQGAGMRTPLPSDPDKALRVADVDAIHDSDDLMLNITLRTPKGAIEFSEVGAPGGVKMVRAENGRFSFTAGVASANEALRRLVYVDRVGGEEPHPIMIEVDDFGSFGAPGPLCALAEIEVLPVEFPMAFDRFVNVSKGMAEEFQLAGEPNGRVAFEVLPDLGPSFGMVTELSPLGDMVYIPERDFVGLDEMWFWAIIGDVVSVPAIVVFSVSEKLECDKVGLEISGATAPRRVEMSDLFDLSIDFLVGGECHGEHVRGKFLLDGPGLVVGASSLEGKPVLRPNGTSGDIAFGPLPSDRLPRNFSFRIEPKGSGFITNRVSMVAANLDTIRQNSFTNLVVEVLPQPRMEIMPVSDDSCRIRIFGQMGLQHRILASSTLTDWEAIRTFTPDEAIEVAEFTLDHEFSGQMFYQVTRDRVSLEISDTDEE